MTITEQLDRLEAELSDALKSPKYLAQLIALCELSQYKLPKLIAALRRAVEILEGTQCTCQQLYVSSIPVHCQRCADINEIQELLK